MASPFFSDTDLGNFITQRVVLSLWRPQATSATLYRSLAKQIIFHGKMWSALPPGRIALGKHGGAETERLHPLDITSETEFALPLQTAW